MSLLRSTHTVKTDDLLSTERLLINGQAMANLIMLMWIQRWAAYRPFDLQADSPERTWSRSFRRRKRGDKASDEVKTRQAERSQI